MHKGTIKFFSNSKGFGFITPDDGTKEIYLSGMAVTAAKITQLMAGQRVSFSTELETRGPKAVKVELLAEKSKTVPSPEPQADVLIYSDPAGPEIVSVKAALVKIGQQPRLVDYLVTPPAPEELKRLSSMLREQNSSLVRRNDAMFAALNLDDRFLGENEFWTAVAEHPSLINGPIVVVGDRACICKTGKDVERFLRPKGSVEQERKPKPLSDRLLAMMQGRPLEPKAEPAKKQLEAAVRPIAAKLKTGSPKDGKPDARKVAKAKNGTASKKTSRKAASPKATKRSPAKVPRKKARR